MSKVFIELATVIANSLKEVGKLAMTEKLSASIVDHFTRVKEELEKLPKMVTSEVTVEEANKAAFERGCGYTTAVEVAKSFGYETISEELYASLFGKFKAPFSEENKPPQPKVGLIASFLLTENKATQRMGRGEGQGGSDKRVIDRALPLQKPTLAYSAIWNAYKAEGDLREFLTEEEKKAAFYQGGGLGTKFFLRMAEQGKLPAGMKSRNALTSWGSGQTVDGSPRFLEVEKDGSPKGTVTPPAAE
ncbi:MAG: hypothetical protein AABY07_00750 [Nanoarchaeota archaeon]